jgi:dTDP-4-amino-4,6-dideoxygalactose transaminase
MGERLIRLPLWNELTEAQATRVVDAVGATLASRVGA